MTWENGSTADQLPSTLAIPQTAQKLDNLHHSGLWAFRVNLKHCTALGA